MYQSIKSCFSIVVRVPILLVLVVLQSIRWLIAWPEAVLLNMERYISKKLSPIKTANNAAQDTEVEPQTRAPQSIAEFAEALDGKTEEMVEWYCQQLELLPGIREDAIRQTHDRKIYAVLKPTRAEYYQRIENALNVLPGEILDLLWQHPREDEVRNHA